MAAFRSLILVLAVSAVISDALFLGPLTTIPIMVGAKIVLVPKVIANAAVIGMFGLKIAGARYLGEKVVVPAALAGAIAGYKAVSQLMDAPQRLAEAQTLGLEKFFHNLRSLPPLSTVPAPGSNFQTTFKVPDVPMPQLQWEEKTVKVPRVVFTEPHSKTITITKHTVPAPSAYPVPEPPMEEVANRPY